MAKTVKVAVVDDETGNEEFKVEFPASEELNEKAPSKYGWALVLANMMGAKL